MSAAGEICRLCFADRPTLHIFSNGGELRRKIQAFCGLQMHDDDGLPEYVCSACADTVDSILSFKFKCETNDRILRRRLDAQMEDEYDYEGPVKDEPDSGAEYPFDETIMNPQVTMVESKAHFKFENGPPSFEEFHPKTEPSVAPDRDRAKAKRPKRLKREKLDHHSTPVERNKEKKFECICPYCGDADFDSPSKFYLHLKTHNDRPFECDICKKTFKSKVHLIPHLRTHTDKDYFQCDICGKLFNSARYTRRHVEEVHNDANVVACNICGKKIKPTSLKGHLKSHNAEKKYECDVCKQKFISKTGVQSHMRIHTGEKPYACRFCESRFTIERTLRDHERLHTGETPYHCPVCDKGFIQLSNMKSHFKNNHKGIEFNYKRKKSTKYNNLTV